MILGGGNCQLSAVRRAKALGHYVILADYTDAPPAAPFADEHLKISSFDTDACLAAARTHGVDGIMTLGTDQPVYTAAAVANALGLPSCISVETALAVTDKQVMKTLLTEAGIPTVDYAFIDRDTTAESLKMLRPPLVIKPLDSQGQRGIFKLDTPEELLGKLPETLSFSRKQTALAEEFYESDEITVSVWVQDGEAYMLSVSDRLHYPDPVHIGVCTGHRFPSVHMEEYPEIEAICRRIAKAFGIENGPLYVQLLRGAHGLLVNEHACRIGGAFEDFVIPYLCGFSILDAVIGECLGEAPDLSMLKGYSPNRCTKQAAVQLTFCSGGRVAAMTPLEEILRLPFVADAGYNFGVGDTVPAMQNATARFGHAVIVGDSRDDIIKNLNSYYDAFKVYDCDGNMMARRFYPQY
ncbi:MAG: ATP-grasp domain-containing protein [Angelakisella sp.]